MVTTRDKTWPRTRRARASTTPCRGQPEIETCKQKYGHEKKQNMVTTKDKTAVTTRDKKPWSRGRKWSRTGAKPSLPWCLPLSETYISSVPPPSSLSLSLSSLSLSLIFLFTPIHKNHVTGQLLTRSLSVIFFLRTANRQQTNILTIFGSVLSKIIQTLETSP